MEAQEIESTTASGSGSVGWLFVFLIICIFVYGAYATTPHTQTARPATLSVAPGGAGHSIYGQPTLSASQINAILEVYHSPASGQGSTLYDLGVQYGIDPAYALAFFMHESTLGTQGEAQTTHSLGNLRCIDGAACIDRERGGYAAFSSWHDGFMAWYQLLTSGLYKGDGLTTVETIIPRYAPTADSNNETAYINALIYCVQSWQAGKVVLS